MGIEETINEILALPAAQQAQVIDFVERLRARANGDGDDDFLGTLTGEPERLARFQAAIDLGWQQSERGEGRPMDEVFAEIRRQTQARREQG